MAARKVLSAGLYSSRVGFQSATVGGAVWLNSRMLTTLSGVKPFSEIPTESGWPIVGAQPLLWKRRGKAGEENVFQHLQKKHGPIYKMKMASFGSSKWLVVASTPEAAEALLRAEGKFPRRGGEKNVMWIHEKNNIPYPMVLSAGEEWRKLRSGASRQVIPRRVGNYTSTMCELASDFADHLVAVRNDDCIVSSIQDELMKFAFRAVCYFAFNEKLDVYGSENQHKDFQELAMKYVQQMSAISMALPLYKIYPTKSYKEFLEVTRAVHQKGKEILKERHKQIKDAIASGTVDETKAVGMLDQWLIEGKFTEEEAVALSCEMLAGGVDSTSHSSTFLLHEVAKHPEVQEKLLHEIKAVLGDKTTATYEDLQKMTLVRNCVKETMRLYYPSNVTVRIPPEDVVISGYHVPARTSIRINMYSISRNSAYFPEPHKFIPERWDRENNYCRRLAELELYSLLTQLIPRFKLSTEQVLLKQLLTTFLQPAEPVNIRFTERK